ncbi:TetR/AcrR family transcriptional regulator [Rufibacter quisquiliarum]|uniref:AcrR family transcriptional regulator n=1 Tax=Rufibacter quisquiliarum TaxID=1549639 RepID=A0A839GPC3_9BACT|nr:TetR family transcriptional regulator C-terminal domain-containing protein [Rufibacter quisquiliarum]MBA9076747.1 AcrR family transcriptional regulator [Rufibacter quisquiliarum]
MENIEKTNLSAKDTRTRILEAFVHHVLETGQEPVSVYKFAQSLSISEQEFYKFYTSFQGVKGGVWDAIFEQTLADMHAQEPYAHYSAKEKLLSFYFTWIEELKKNRSYLLALYEKQPDFKKVTPQEVQSFKTKYLAFAKTLVQEGKETEQIANRKYISDKYPEVLWLETLFIFQFWLKDTSPGFERTDAAIEKSVNLFFDVIGRNAVDSFFDFAKFLYQSK